VPPGLEASLGVDRDGRVGRDEFGRGRTRDPLMRRRTRRRRRRFFFFFFLDEKEE
jgi:hypothetical protein